MAGLLLLAAAAGYLLAAGAYAVYIIRRSDQAATAAGWVLRGALAAHSLNLAVLWWQAGQMPVVSLRHSLSFFAWAAALGYLAASRRVDVKALGAFVAPFCLCLMILSLTGPRSPAHQTMAGLSSAWLVVHIASAFLGDGFFAVAAAAGAMYLIQERQLKRKRFGWLFGRLPALQSLDRLSHACLVWGFPLLTLGMLTGAFYAHLTTGVFWRWDGKEVWSLITWLVYAALLHQRLTVGWQGRRAALGALAGFAVLVFTFAGASLLSAYHDFETFGLK